MRVHLPAPSLSVRVWNGSPHEFLIKAAELTRTGIGLPAYYNDEVIIPALQNRGLSLADAREYNIIGCVEPQKAGKTEAGMTLHSLTCAARWRWFSPMVWTKGYRSVSRPAMSQR